MSSFIHFCMETAQRTNRKLRMINQKLHNEKHVSADKNFVILSNSVWPHLNCSMRAKLSKNTANYVSTI